MRAADRSAPEPLDAETLATVEEFEDLVEIAQRRPIPANGARIEAAYERALREVRRLTAERDRLLMELGRMVDPRFTVSEPVDVRDVLKAAAAPAPAVAPEPPAPETFRAPTASDYWRLKFREAETEVERLTRLLSHKLEAARAAPNATAARCECEHPWEGHRPDEGCIFAVTDDQQCGCPKAPPAVTVGPAEQDALAPEERVEWRKEAEHWLLSAGTGMLGMPDARATGERRILRLLDAYEDVYHKWQLALWRPEQDALAHRHLREADWRAAVLAPIEADRNALRDKYARSVAEVAQLRADRDASERAINARWRSALDERIASPGPTVTRLTYGDDGMFDEFCAHNVDVHIERMSNTGVWMRIHEHALWFNSKRRIRVLVEPDASIVDAARQAAPVYERAQQSPPEEVR